MKKIILLMIALFSINVAASDSSEPIRKLFSYIEDGNYEKAIVESLLDAYRDLGIDTDYEEVKSETAYLITQMQQVGKAFGPMLGYDLVVEKSLGKRYKRAKYVLYYGQQPVELILALYAPRKKWAIRNIHINTYVTDEFEKYFESVYE